MHVKVLFFASIKDIVGSRELSMDIPAGSTVKSLLDRLEKSYPKIRPYRPIVLVSVNEEYAQMETPVGEGDEVAIFPPVSGGAPDTAISPYPCEMYRITREPIAARDLAGQLVRPEAGAICIFEGIVRNYTFPTRALPI